MKQKSKDWKDLRREDKIRFIMGRATGVCWCNPALGENCEKCKDLPEMKEEDRNYHEEVILLLYDMRNTSRNPEVYSILLTLYQLDDEESFNQAIRYEFVENLGTEEYSWGNAFSAYHKTLRQYDHYGHLSITNQNTNDYESGSCFQSILYDIIGMSDIPYQVIKKLMSL